MQCNRQHFSQTSFTNKSNFSSLRLQFFCHFELNLKNILIPFQNFILSLKLLQELKVSLPIKKKLEHHSFLHI